MRALIGILIMLSYGCSVGDSFTDVLLDDPSSVYWDLSLNHHAITLSMYEPWNTMQLVATPYTYKGEALPAEDASVTYVSADSNIVGVSSEGVVIAKRTTNSTRIIATLKLGHITRVDTAFVRVLDQSAPVIMDTFAIRLAPGDSAKFAADASFDLSKYIVRKSGADIDATNILVYYKSSSQDIANLDRTTGRTAGQSAVGRVTFHASSYAFGAYGHDSIGMKVGFPIYNTKVYFQEKAAIDSLGTERFSTIPHATIGVGGLIEFHNQTSDTMDFFFADTASIEIVDLLPGLGLDPTINRISIPPFREGGDLLDVYKTIWRRAFTKPGTYVWNVKRFGITGKVTVVDES